MRDSFLVCITHHVDGGRYHLKRLSVVRPNGPLATQIMDRGHVPFVGSSIPAYTYQAR
jgi:hypothetical protein